MKAPSNKNSFRYFPADLFLVFGGPLLIAIPALLMGSLSSLNESTSKFLMVLAFLIALTGAGLLAWAKLPLYQSGIYFSFGPSPIPAPRRVYYYWGMGLSIIGCFFAGLLVLAQ